MVWGSKWKGKWCNCNFQNTINSKKRTERKEMATFFFFQKGEMKTKVKGMHQIMLWLISNLVSWFIVHLVSQKNLQKSFPSASLELFLTFS